jgi:hypothetical protein
MLGFSLRVVPQVGLQGGLAVQILGIFTGKWLKTETLVGGTNYNNKYKRNNTYPLYIYTYIPRGFTVFVYLILYDSIFAFVCSFT